MPWICPECGEEAVQRSPYDLTPQQTRERPHPVVSHRDGTQLCPVVGPHGYEPTQPVRR